jgi:predicted transcriptional regulator of viral defense system
MDSKTPFPIEEIDYNYLKSYLSGYKNIRVKINDMLKKKELIRIKKGLYILGAPHSTAPFYRETLSNLIYGPSYISLEYALSFYGMIPERTTTVTAVTNKRNKIFETPVGYFSYRYLHPALYAEEVDIFQLDERHNILIASKEKAVCDMLYFAETMGSVQRLCNYLFNHLRIEEGEVKQLSNKKVNRLAGFYGKNVSALADYLKEVK